MSGEVKQLLRELKGRLPELEWQISEMRQFFPSHHLPKGLFRCDLKGSGIACIEEIKVNIDSLEQQKNQSCALFLVTRIQYKINVLVGLCVLHRRNKNNSEKIHFGVNTLSTRQQWIQDLELKIQALQRQEHALQHTLQQMLSQNHSPEAILEIKANIGQITKHLTTAQETLMRATFV